MVKFKNSKQHALGIWVATSLIDNEKLKGITEPEEVVKILTIQFVDEVVDVLNTIATQMNAELDKEKEEVTKNVK